MIQQPCRRYVADSKLCRNNSEKISPKFLESGQNRRTFASSSDKTSSGRRKQEN
jgi:hypothetical protein